MNQCVYFMYSLFFKLVFNILMLLGYLLYICFGFFFILPQLPKLFGCLLFKRCMESTSSFLKIDPAIWTNTNILRNSLLKSMVCYFLTFLSHPPVPPFGKKSALCLYSFTVFVIFNIYNVSLWKLDQSCFEPIFF